MVSIILSMISLLAVYSSVSGLAYTQTGGDTLYYLIKHMIMIGSGFAIMYFAHKVHYRIYSRLAVIAIWVSAALLLLTLLVGATNADATRWLRIPIVNQNFQTSDLAKIALIAYVARMLVVKREVLGSFREGLLPILLPILMICGLILPANFSTAALLFAVCFMMLFIGGIPARHLLSVVGVAVLGLSLLIGVSSVKPDLLPRLTTWKMRLINFDSGDSEVNYQVEHAMMAIKSGGILPQGPGTGDSRNYLPNAYNDMIYAFIIEEYGLILGGCGLILLYLIFAYRSLKITRLCQRDFGVFMVVGLSFLICTQAFINMGVSVNLFPVTGQPLPLVSMGGTSIWFTCLAIGMILSVSRAIVEGEKAVHKESIKPKQYAFAKGNH